MKDLDPSRPVSLSVVHIIGRRVSGNQDQNLVRVARSIFEIADKALNTATSGAAIDNSAPNQSPESTGLVRRSEKATWRRTSRIRPRVACGLMCPKPHRRKMESVLAGGYVSAVITR